MSKNQFIGTAMQRNRKFCQFNKDQYCINIGIRGLPVSNDDIFEDFCFSFL